jgi:hypothetical protein
LPNIIFPQKKKKKKGEKKVFILVGEVWWHRLLMIYPLFSPGKILEAIC